MGQGGASGGIVERNVFGLPHRLTLPLSKYSAWNLPIFPVPMIPSRTFFIVDYVGIGMVFQSRRELSAGIVNNSGLRLIIYGSDSTPWLASL
jgi:hypothetical protein